MFDRTRAAVLDSGGRLHAFTNRQAGDFVAMEAAPPATPGAGASFLAMTVADLDADGAFDIVTADSAGLIARTSRVRRKPPRRPPQRSPSCAG